MGASNIIRINGTAFDSSCVNIRVATFRLSTAIKEIKYGQKRTRARVPGFNRSRGPVVTTSGTYEADPCTMSIRTDVAAELRDFLAKRAKTPSYGDAFVPIIVQYTALDMKEVKDELLKCAVENDASSASAGSPDPLYEEWSWHVTRIKRNGKTLHSFDPLLGVL